jgi:uncharacterized membrane protein
MFNELYQKVVENKLFTYFKENNFNSLDLDRVLAEVNRSKKLYGDFDLVKIITDVRSAKLLEAAPAPAPAAGAAPAVQAPAPTGGAKPAAPAAAPDPKAAQQQKQQAAAATKLVQDIDAKWKDFSKLLLQAKTTVQSLFTGK